MILRTLRIYAWPYRAQLALVGGLMVLESLTTLAVPWVAGRLAADVVTAGSAPTGRIVALLILALAILAVLKFTVRYQSAIVSERLLADLRRKLYDHLQSLPLGFHHLRRQGDTLALMTYEIGQLSRFISSTLVSVPPLVLTASGAIALMFWLNPYLALLAPTLIPLFYLLLKIIGRQLRGLARSVQEAEAEAVAIAEENLEVLPAIKTYTREQVESRRFGAQIERIHSLSVKEAGVYAALEPSIRFLAATAAVVLLFLLGQNLEQGDMTTADMFRFLFYAAALTSPVAALADVYGRTQTARGTLARLHSVFAIPSEHAQQQPTRIGRARGDITFEDVTFGYQDRDLTLRDVNLRIGAGEVVALSGENGAGKSTIISLLLRLYDPLGGRILLDGQDIAEMSRRLLEAAAAAGDPLAQQHAPAISQRASDGGP